MRKFGTRISMVFVIPFEANSIANVSHHRQIDLAQGKFLQQFHFVIAVNAPTFRTSKIQNLLLQVAAHGVYRIVDDLAPERPQFWQQRCNRMGLSRDNHHVDDGASRSNLFPSTAYVQAGTFSALANAAPLSRHVILGRAFSRPNPLALKAKLEPTIAVSYFYACEALKVVSNRKCL